MRFLFHRNKEGSTPPWSESDIFFMSTAENALKTLSYKLP